MRVPALNEFVHGLTGKVGATPGCSCFGSVKKRTSGRSADAAYEALPPGTPASEKTTTP